MLPYKTQAPHYTLHNLPTQTHDGCRRNTAAPRHPKLVQGDKPRKLVPSEFAHEMCLTTEERLASTHEIHTPRILELFDMSENTHQKFSAADVDQPLFQPHPSEIVFQNYQPCETYEVPLVFRNTDKIPHLLKVIVENSLYFQVVSPQDVSKKVAPGMTSTFTVLFTPQENKDYAHRVICVTERERFEVPVRSIGARAILDFPDQLFFPLCPVKSLSQKTILVRNVGNGEAKFTLSTESPFSVNPSAGTLGVEESMQVTVDFTPRTTGDHSQQLLLHYHTGENVHIDLYGASTDISVRLDKNTVLIEKTYITMANQRRVAILNRSDSMVHYVWKNFSTEKEEEQCGLRLCPEPQQEGDNMEEFLAVCNADSTVRHRLLKLTDTLHNRRRLAEPHQHHLSYNFQNFIIEPQDGDRSVSVVHSAQTVFQLSTEGDIFPYRTAEINIIFKPQEARLYQHTVYCDITGREARLPLRIKGEGIGPKLELSYDLLDMGNIFLGATHVYEVIVRNEGLIDAPYKLMPPSTAVGLCFSFSPAQGMVPPGDSHAIEVRFTSTSLGTFSEEFHFMVMGNLQPLSLTFSGCVTGPTFHFNIPEFSFGEVSFGFPNTITCCINNTSLVPMDFGLRIPGDGTGRDSVSSTEQVTKLDRNEWKPWDRAAARPREFRVTPSSGSIRALSKINIEVTLCSNTVQEYSMALVVDVQGVGEEVMALPIKARCVVPELHLERQTLQFSHCFLGYPYEQSIRLVNDTNLPACFGLVPQAYEEDPSLLVTTSRPRGIIQPNSTEEISLVLKAKKLGHLSYAAIIAILGQEDPQLELLLTCFGQGPAVSISTTQLHFGSVPVLADVPKTLQLYNHSPIPAHFLAQMEQSRSPWRVEPAEGDIPPMEQLELKLVAYLDDTLPFQDKLQLAIQDGETHTVSVSALGNGTTITTDRPFGPSLDLGTHFSSEPCRYHFRVINRGRRMHILRWDPEGPQPSQPTPTRVSHQRKSKTPLATPSVDAPVFTLSPVWVELGPGKAAEMLLEGSCNRPEVVKERLVCHAHIGPQKVKKRIMTVEVTCRFIAPVLEASPQQLHFYVEKVPSTSLVPLYERLHLKNISTLTFTMQLTLTEPFSLCNHTDDDFYTTSKTLVMDAGAETVLLVRFDPSYLPGPVSRVYEEVLEVHYSEHPQRDTVVLHGEVHYPNLHFSTNLLDFGCVLNHTETQRQLIMTNCSPLPVSYHWTFQIDQHQHCIRQRGVPIPQLDEKKHLKNEKEEGSVSVSCKDDPRVMEPIRESLTQSPCETELDLLTTRDNPSLRVEEVFDIFPNKGVLHPGETLLVTFSFFGHADISSEVLARCEVEEGPTYDVILRGEASVISYVLDTRDLDFGAQFFNDVVEAEITLRNTAKVGFDFRALLEVQQSSEDPVPGLPFLIPSEGHVEAYAERKLTVCYLPGVPEAFQKTLQIQVAFSEPENITLRGEGIFPRVCLDLPRDLDESQYSSVLQQARETVETERQREEALSPAPTPHEEQCEDHTPTYDALLQMEVERLLLKEHVTDHQESPRDTEHTETPNSTSQWRRKLSMFVLPEYLLNFGCVIHGTVPSHIVKVTNTGPVPVTFRADWRLLTGTGFSTELDRVKNLPYCETETFEIKFDPRGANLKLGETSAVLPIQVLGGPTVHVRLRAVVSMPSLTITHTLQFDSVQCGFCKVSTVQLHNTSLVPCKWSVLEEEQQKRKAERHVVSRRQRDSLKELPSPVIFKMLPSSGVVSPGDRVNVRVRFSPAEEKMYKKRLALTISQSVQQVLLLVEGQGVMPHLNFCPSEWLLEPLLPSSGGQEFEVVVQNPCSFPIEFYSLEFDKQHLEEEKILRMMKGYDTQNVMLLPPRAPGQPLPPGLLEYYREHNSHELDSRTAFVGDLEMNAVTGAMTSMSSDGTAEVQAACRRMGISIIVHGAPLSGKTDLALKLAKHYGVACLSVDSVVQDAVSSGSSSAALQARELCGTMEIMLGTAEKTGVVGGAGQSLGVLSVEAVARHTEEAGQDSKPTAPASTISTHNKSSITDNPTVTSTVQTLQAGQVQMFESETESQMDGLRVRSVSLPDELLVEILAERLQLSDCQRGVVMDGLETQYCSSLSAVLQIILKAFNNRKHIYIINLTDSYGAFTQREREREQRAEALQREKMEREQLRLLEMDEDEYDVLPDEEKEFVDLQQLKVLRHSRRRDRERLEMEERRRKQEELERQQDEKEKRKHRSVRKRAPVEDTAPNRGQTERDGKDSPLECARRLDEEGKKKENEAVDETPDEHGDPPPPDAELNTEADRQLLTRFQLYEQSQTQVQHILQYWDRTQGLLLVPPLTEEQLQEPEETTESQAPSTKKKVLEKERAEREHKEKERVERKEKERPKTCTDVRVPSQACVLAEGTEEPEEQLLPVPISSICMPIHGEERVNVEKLLSSLQLPSLQMVLDGLGLGPSGPFMPPPTLFSVVCYPEERSVPSAHRTHGFTFLEPSCPEDLTQEKEKEEVPTMTEDKGRKSTGTKQLVKGSMKSQSRKGGKTSPSSSEPQPPHQSRSVQDTEEDLRKRRLAHFRWVVPANGQTTLKIWFETSELGVFNEKLSFELLGTKRCYQLTFKGICAYPSISTDHETVFAYCKKVVKPENGLQKSFIIRSGLYDFGPQLCRKTTDRCNAQASAENTERLVIHNNSPMDAEVEFSFQHGPKSSTFLLTPQSMFLKPDERKELSVSACPTAPDVQTDSVVCNIKDNPNPVIFHISCIGVQPKLEVDLHSLSFGKVLLQRTVKQNLLLKNPTVLPVAWRLTGLEEQSNEISAPHNMGVIMPNSTFSLPVYFHAKKPINVNKKIMLTVSDEDYILGTVQSVVIDITAEPYDVALDITFPKGGDGLNFGTVKVSEEAKLTVNLKNKCKHEISFSFSLEPTMPGMPDLNSIFTIMPPKGSLHPNAQKTNVQFTFHHNREVSIIEQPILKCQVIESNVVKGGETIFSVPIKVSVQSLLSKYRITPSNELNFGALACKCRETRTITLENQGPFDIRFTFSKLLKHSVVPEQKKRDLSRESHTANSPTTNNQQQCLSLGMFTLTPCCGSLLPGEQKVVSVVCAADRVGYCTEDLTVDISDRDTSESPIRIPYCLLTEICVPGIDKDVASIFKEHQLCKNMNVLHCDQYRDAMGIYVQDENKFVFNNVLVGQSAKARFCLTNPGKVTCELTLQVKTVQTKTSPHSYDAFELTATRLSIPSHSHTFATVIFTPQNMQTYFGVCEATLEDESGKSKALGFDLMGEGNLPCITVLKPAYRNSQGWSVLQFKRLLVGRRQTLPLVIKNMGSVPAQVSLELHDMMAVFTLRVSPRTVYSHNSSSKPGREQAVVGHVSTLTLMAEQLVELEVEFCPTAAQNFEAQIQLVVRDNPYEKAHVKLVGEAYSDIISLDFISNKVPQEQHSTDVTSELLHFEDCHVGRLYQHSFIMSNHSHTEVLRFQWLHNSPNLRFSPQTGHLHAGCTKEVTVSFSSEQPVVLNQQVVKCNLCQISFQQPVDQVPDWDDRQHTVKWVNVDAQTLPQQPAKKVKETDPEPRHSVVENSSRELELQISATCDYAKFECKTEPIHFEDTTLYQTRVFQLKMTNSGTVRLEYSWQVMLEASRQTMGSSDGGVTPQPSQASQTELRPASSLDTMSGLLLGRSELLPFSVEPSVGIIQPGHDQTFHIRFIPLTVAESEARLVCSIPNLKDEQAPVVELRGRSLLPCCHIDLQEPDDLLSDLQLHHRATMDPKTRILQFTSVGLGMNVCKEFGVINPTNKQYSTQWICEDSEEKPFTCLTPKNIIQPAKKAMVSFQFQAERQDVVESLWTLFIPELRVSLPFLLVGFTKDPELHIDPSHLHLGSKCIGCKTSETVYVVNKEEHPFHFTLVEASRHSEDSNDSLCVEPTEGTVSPRDKLPVILSFTPTQKGTVSFNLLFFIRGKVHPLSLSVKVDCYSVDACVQCESPEGDITQLSPTALHTVSFKQVTLGDKSMCAFVVSNQGRAKLNVQYELTGPPELQRLLQVEPRTAEVEMEGQSRCVLTFLPLQKGVLKDISFSVKIKHGPIFSCSLLGSAVAPALDFSFHKHDFGTRFIYTSGTVPTTHKLLISNKGEREISVDCSFTNTSYLEVIFMPEMLAPGDCMEIPFTFFPREAVKYHEKVIFKINKCVKQAVEILGEGMEMKIDVEDPKHKILKLGALQVGQKRKKLIPLINSSPSALSFSIHFSPSAVALLKSKVLLVRPHREVTIQGRGGKCVLEVLFSPQQRMAPFSEELQIECLGSVFPLLVLKGCCQDLEVMLDQNHLAFGAVVKHCQATRRIVLQNTGDIGTRFQWDVKSFAPDLRIVPAKGYICPGTEVPLEVTFTPVEVKPDVQYENLQCYIEGGRPLTLSLSGSCIAPTPVSKVIHFVCPVRGQCTQSLTLQNHTGQLWVLNPIIEGECWSASPSLIIEPHQREKAYQITYKPMVMTKDKKKHMGSVFIPDFPHGSGVLYTLQGTAEPPKAASSINRDVPCWTPYTEMLPVHNWLPKPQKFRAEMKLESSDVKQSEQSDISFSLSGLDYVDVAALEKRDYRLSFISYKLGKYTGKVTFKNETTGEYLYYDLNFETKTPGDISTIKVVSTVRQTASVCVKLDNPLPNELEFTATCSNTDVLLPKARIKVPALSEATLMFEYQALQAGEFTSQLVLSNTELCSLQYKLLLQALPPPPEKPLYFRAALGSSHQLSVKFTHYSRDKNVLYTCKVDCPDFTVEKSIKPAAGLRSGSEMSFPISFVPSKLGEHRGLLSLSSSHGGDYVFPLYATCVRPKAQGPLDISSGSKIIISFKNPFPQPTAFSFHVDNPAFTVRGVDTFEPKESRDIVVSFVNPSQGSKSPCTGKLSIWSPRAEGQDQVLSWIYYLRGVTSEALRR